MGAGIVVQARMSSKRLPGKVLAPLAGRPMLDYTLERLEGAGPVVVATSADPSDDAVAGYCAARGAEHVRGPLEDVAARLALAASRFGFDAVARISGDSPLIDPAIVARGIKIFSAGSADLVTNVHPRTFPPGQSVEVLGPRALAAAAGEHVTAPIYADPGGLSIHNFESGCDYGELRLTVDTEEERRSVEAILQRMERPHVEYGLDEIAALAG